MKTVYIVYLGLTTLLEGNIRNTTSAEAEAAAVAADSSRNYGSELAKAFYEPDPMLEKSVETIYINMNPEQRAAQMIMVASTSSGSDKRKALNLVEEEVAGGVLLLKGSKKDFEKQVEEFRKLTRKDNLPPLFSCDCEPSLLRNKWSGSRSVLPASEHSNDSIAAAQARIVTKEMREVGAALNFAPVVDNATNQSIINNRSYGADNEVIISRSTAFIQATQQDGIAATVKHFPGHGAVKGDSHKATVYINGPFTELDNFRQVIQEAAPLVVMVGHITVRGNNPWATGDLPASISRKLVTGLLREELGFEGIVTTDAMNMKAVSRYKNADWKAVEAGVDLIVMPEAPRQLHNQIVEGLMRGDAMSRQLEQSIKRIIRLKLLTGNNLPDRVELAEAED